MNFSNFRKQIPDLLNQTVYHQHKECCTVNNMSMTEFHLVPRLHWRAKRAEPPKWSQSGQELHPSSVRSRLPQYSYAFCSNVDAVCRYVRLWIKNFTFNVYYQSTMPLFITFNFCSVLSLVSNSRTSLSFSKFSSVPLFYNNSKLLYRRYLNI